LLVRDVAREFGEQVRVVDENFGASRLAERFGVKRYPAVFVDEALVARPEDFFGWDKQRKGRYMPFKDAQSHALFKTDLRRMLKKALARETLESAASPEGAAVELYPVAALPRFEATRLDGSPLSSADLAGRVVVVELWATWCPPCIQTLPWLGGLAKRLGSRVGVVAVVVESPEEEARTRAQALPPEVSVVAGTEALQDALGGVTAVPTLLVFGRDGRTAGAFYGAPPDREAKVDRLVETLLAGKPGP
jgi:thiol-disulfide isomerase/thioredoxin